MLEFVAQRLAPLQEQSWPMLLFAGPADPMRLSAPLLAELTIKKMCKILRKEPSPMLLAGDFLPLYR